MSTRARRPSTRRSVRSQRASTRASGRSEGAHPRADWKGHIAFGLVEIPVALRTAERRTEQLKFSLVDRRDRAPVGNVRVNKVTGEEVPWSEIVKGYEYEKGDYVLMDESELRRANVEASRSIDIVDFVDGDSIDPAFFSEPYHVLPARPRGNRAYALLHAALERTGKVGIATVVLRTRQHLAALTTRGPLLALLLMRWSHDLTAPESVALPEDSHDARIPPRELAMAEQLVESMSSDWRPGKFKDTYHEDIMALIQRKIRSGHTGAAEHVEPEPEPERTAPVLDLMPLLERSLQGRRRAPRTRARPRHRQSA